MANHKDFITVFAVNPLLMAIMSWQLAQLSPRLWKKEKLFLFEAD